VFASCILHHESYILYRVLVFLRALRALRGYIFSFFFVVSLRGLIFIHK